MYVGFFDKLEGLKRFTYNSDCYVTALDSGNLENSLIKQHQPKYNILLNSLSSDIDLELGAMGNFDEILLSENEFFLLGDNRLECSDSRLWGPIKKSELKGKVLCTYFPFSEVRFF